MTRNLLLLPGSRLCFYIGWFAFFLLLCIVLQGAAVFIFKGAWFSLIYMALNVVTLLFVMYESQTITATFNEFCEEIIHLPTRGRLLIVSFSSSQGSLTTQLSHR